MAKQLTVRGVPDEVSRRLEELSRATGKSVNATALEVRDYSFGVDARRRRLEPHATWSGDEYRELQASLAAQRAIDPEIWG